MERDSTPGKAFFPENVCQIQYLPLSTFTNTRRENGTTDASSWIGMEALTTTSSSILKLAKTNISGPGTVIEGPTKISPSLSLQDRRTPEKSTLTPSCNEAKRTSSTSTIMCEYPGCTVKFGRNKDRNRHFRLKHQANEGFRCPLVDCSMGTGHKIQRRDKLREHLKRKGGASLSWQCVLPDCSMIVAGRSDMIGHLGQHDRITRLTHQQLLIDYSFITGDLHPGTWYDKPPLGYLTCSFICDVPGCPFGTDSRDDMDDHGTIPHEGAYCPCPMPNCPQIFQDWGSASAHLARSHDADDREAHEKKLLNQGFWWRNSVFTCPICKVEIKILLNKASCDEKIRDHCSRHETEFLDFYKGELVRTFASSNRRRLWYPRMPLLNPATDEQVFAYLTWPKERLLEIWKMDGLV